MKLVVNKFGPAAIFADNMGLQLKAGVTEKQIKQIPNEYLKELGLALLSGNYESAYRLADYRPYQNPAVMATRNKTSKYSLRDNPTEFMQKLMKLWLYLSVTFMKVVKFQCLFKI